MTGLLLPPIKILSDGSVTLAAKLAVDQCFARRLRARGALSWSVCWCYQVQYDGSTIGAEESKILDHFFASEIKWACNSKDAAWPCLGPSSLG